MLKAAKQLLENRGVRFGIKEGKIGSKLDKSVTFQISVHSGSPSHNKTDLKKSEIYPIYRTTVTQFRAKPGIPGETLYRGGNHNS